MRRCRLEEIRRERLRGGDGARCRLEERTCPGFDCHFPFLRARMHARTQHPLFDGARGMSRNAFLTTQLDPHPNPHPHPHINHSLSFFARQLHKHGQAPPGGAGAERLEVGVSRRGRPVVQGGGGRRGERRRRRQWRRLASLRARSPIRFSRLPPLSVVRRRRWGRDEGPEPQQVVLQ